MKGLTGWMVLLGAAGTVLGQGMIVVESKPQYGNVGGDIDLNVYAVGGAAQYGLNLYLYLADGGASGASLIGLEGDHTPYITIGDPDDALIEGAWNTSYVPSWACYLIDASVSPFEADGLLATVRVRIPAGIPIGTQIIVTAGSPDHYGYYPGSDYGEQPSPQYWDGIITTGVPEPATAMLLVAVVPLLRRRSRRVARRVHT